MEVNKIDIGKNIADGLASRAEFLKDAGKDIAEGSIFGAVQDISEDAINNFGKGAQAGIVLGKDAAENFGAASKTGFNLGQELGNYALDIIKKEKDE